MNQRMQRREGGFTLVELMVVIVILGLLAGVGVTYFMQTLEDSKVDVAKTKCNSMQDSITTYIMQHQSDVGPDEILDVMVEKKRLNADKLDDPWGERFVVTLDEDGNYKVHSKGKDRQDGTEDDVWDNGKGMGGGSGGGSGF